MKVTKAAAYAQHALMYMVRHSTQLPITADEISKGEGIPRGYLVKVLHQLAKNGLIRQVRGRGTRYTLAKPPEEISLLEVIEGVEGRPFMGECLLKHCKCSGTPENCHIYSQWARSIEIIRKALADTNLATASWNHPEHRFAHFSKVADSDTTEAMASR